MLQTNKEKEKMMHDSIHITTRKKKSNEEGIGRWTSNPPPYTAEANAHFKAVKEEKEGGKDACLQASTKPLLPPATDGEGALTVQASKLLQWSLLSPAKGG